MDRPALVDFYRSSRARTPARHQETIAAGATDAFRVLTFNMLAQGSIKREMFPYCATDTLKWAVRRNRLAAEIEAYDADICAFQVPPPPAPAAR